MALREQSGLESSLDSGTRFSARLSQCVAYCTVKDCMAVKVYYLRTLYALPCVQHAAPPFHTHRRLVCLPTSSLGMTC